MKRSENNEGNPIEYRITREGSELVITAADDTDNDSDGDFTEAFEVLRLPVVEGVSTTDFALCDDSATTPGSLFDDQGISGRVLFDRLKN